jgi:uncharacterized HAD superfamily protein
MRNTICVDFDGTIASKNTYDPTQINATPNKGVHDALTRLSKDYTVIIYTTRLSPSQNPTKAMLDKNTKLLTDWLTLNDFDNSHYQGMTGIKIPALYYIDDHGYHFTSWDKTLQDLHGL